MVPPSLKALQPRVIRRARCRKIAGRHNAKARGCCRAFVSRYRPRVCVAVKDRLFNPGIELDIASEVETIGHMVDVTQDLGLRAVTLGPMPLLLQLVREGIGVLQAFDVAATSRVAVPVPGAANPATRLKGTHLETKL